MPPAPARLLRPATTYAAIVGIVLVRTRTELALDQSAVAAAVGVTQSTWSRIERGISPLTIEQLRSVSDALHSSPSAITARADALAARVAQVGIHVQLARTPLTMSDGWITVGAAGLREIEA